MDERNRLILDEARAALSQQRDDLHKVRDRTSSLLSAGGLVATFFGALTLRNEAGLTIWIYGAAVMVVALAGVTTYIQRPRVFTFINDPSTMLEDWPLDTLDADGWARRLAECLDEDYRKNSEKITRLMWAYIGGLTAFAAEVGLFGIDLALR
jgi:hypothetical protein